MTLAAWYRRVSMRLPARTRRAAGQTAGQAAGWLGIFGGPLGLALVLALSACGSGSSEQPRGVSSIELTDCSAGSVEAKCGVLHVQENRDAPNGRTIALSILVAPASSRTPASDPVFLLAGGPGQGAASLAPMILHKFEAILRDRDLVFVDLRGTGESGPLVCDVEHPEDLAELLGGQFEVERLAPCLERYEAEGGVDLTQYTTAQMVDDLDEVRAALGYGPVNLFAISYGTLVAQVYMRRHPEQVRSAVLDGVVPTDAGVLLGMPANAERALELVLADCREHSACASVYPGLERKLAQVLLELEQNRVLEELVHPRTGQRTRVDITRTGFMQVLTGALYSTSTTVLVPLLIERAHAGDYGPLAAVGLRMASMSKSLSTGVYLSVSCAEQLDRVDEAARRQATAGLEFFDDVPLEQLERACAVWPHATLDAAFHEPVESAVPTLLLSGRFDPVTPPAYAEQLAGQLGDARHVVVDALSHGVWHNGCAPELIASFFLEPDPGALDPACLEQLERQPAFLSPNGPWRSAAQSAEPSAEQSGDPAVEPSVNPPEPSGALAQGQLMHRSADP
jgi:pimeloyl-ACP methyl ester carboxylesterase